MAVITLYKFPQSVALTMTRTPTVRNNLPLTEADFKVFQGVFNKIDFVVRDNDRKPVNLVGKSVSINIFSFHEQVLQFSKSVEIIDASKGKLLLTLTPDDTFKLLSGFYSFSFRVNNPDGSYEILYTDLDHNGSSFFELIEGVMPAPLESTQLTPGSFSSVNVVPYVTKYVSGAFAGDSLIGQSDGLHTFSVLADNFSGKFYAQGSINEPLTNDQTDWFDIWLTSTKPELEWKKFTGIDAFNFTANVMWVRFSYIPDADNVGSIKKILYRN